MQTSIDPNRSRVADLIAAIKDINPDRVYAFLTILPSIILVAIFVYGFIGQTFYWSLTDWMSLEENAHKKFVGLDNYTMLFSEAGGQRFRQELVNTFFFTSFFLSGCLVLGFLLAVLLDQNIKGEGIFRTVFLFPMALSFAVTGTIWRWLLNPKGGINVLPKALGAKAWNFRWLNNRDPFEFNWHQVPIATTLLIIFILVFFFTQQILRRKSLTAVYVGVPMVLLFLWMVSDWIAWDDQVGTPAPVEAGVTILRPTEELEIAEGGTTATYSLALDSIPSGHVVITLSADKQSQVEPESLIFKQSDWNEPQFVTVRAVDDDRAEGVHNTTIKGNAISTDAAYNRAAIDDVEIKVIDNDEIGVALSIPNELLQVIEGRRAAAYTLTLTSPPSIDVEIAISPGARLFVVPSAVVFTPFDWNEPQMVTVLAVDDSEIEGTQTSAITHTITSADLAYDGLALENVAVTVIDNEAGVLLVQPDGQITVIEGGAADSYDLALSSPPGADVTIDIVFDDTRLSVTPSKVVFTSEGWNALQTVTVEAVDNDAADGPLSSTISHKTTSDDAAYQGITLPGVDVAIIDNDTPGVRLVQSEGRTAVAEGGAVDSYDLVLNMAPAADVTVDLVFDADQITVSPPSLTFTPENWDTPQTVTTEAVDDEEIEAPYTTTISHTVSVADPESAYNGLVVEDVLVTVDDDDNQASVTIIQPDGVVSVTEGGASGVYEMVLDSTPTASVEIALESDAQVRVEPSSLTFTPENWTIPQTVTVVAVDENQAEGPHLATITSHIISAAPDYNTTLAIEDVVVHVADNDIPGLALTTTRLKAGEGESGTYDLVLKSPPTADVKITLTPDNQLAVEPKSITFTPRDWNIPQMVTVTAQDDAKVEGALHSGTLVHTVSSDDPDYDGLAVADFVVYITDNDVAGVLVDSGNTTSVKEDRVGDPDTYEIVLMSQPGSDVTISLSTNEQITLEPPSLVFTPDDWDQPQEVTVTAVDDTLIEGEGLHASLVTHTVTSDDPAYNHMTAPGAVVTVDEDDFHVMHGTFNWQDVPRYVSAAILTGFILFMISLLWKGRLRAALYLGIPTGFLLIWYAVGGPDRFPNVPAPETFGFNLALVGVIIAAMWQMSGYTMAMYLAGIRGIPEELCEAARVDGCNEWQVYMRVVLPMLRPITLSAAIVLGHISLKVFDLIFAMAGIDHLPVSVPGVQVYYTMFRSNKFAVGSAIAVVLLLMVASVIIPYLITSLRTEHEL